jgi:hypothetical protein
MSVMGEAATVDGDAAFHDMELIIKKELQVVNNQ